MFYVAGGGVQVNLVQLQQPLALVISLEEHAMHICIVPKQQQ